MSKANHNYKVVKENLDTFGHLFKEEDPDLKIKQELFSLQAFNPFINYNSSPRGLMMSSHIAQLVVLNKPEKNMIQTSLDRELGKYVISKKFMHDSEIIDVIKRYSGLGWRKEEVTEYTIIFRRLDDGKVDSITIPLLNKFHNYFGFKYKLLIDPETMTPGNIYKKDTYIAVPSTILNEDLDYGFGLNTNVCLMSLPETAEDGVVVSKSYCKRMAFKIFEKRTLHVTRDEILLNLYGDDKNYKPFPEIGEEINEHGILLATRKIDDDIILGLLSNSELRKANPIFDNTVYAKGKVIDVKVFKNDKNKMTPMQPDEFLNKYIRGLEDYHKRIFDSYNRIKRSNPDLELGYLFNRQITTSLNVVNSTDGRLKKMYRKESIDLYRIEIEVEVDLIPTVGYKITDLNGGLKANV